uniref:Uncharacterized protein n=1 Tax=Anguilla anguilla TaxID=7936 RepID=A0A0E9TX33_ANGAN
MYSSKYVYKKTAKKRIEKMCKILFLLFSPFGH